jgi:hypothetical protein
LKTFLWVALTCSESLAAPPVTVTLRRERA